MLCLNAILSRARVTSWNVSTANEVPMLCHNPECLLERVLAF